MLQPTGAFDQRPGGGGLSPDLPIRSGAVEQPGRVLLDPGTGAAEFDDLAGDDAEEDVEQVRAMDEVAVNRALGDVRRSRSPRQLTAGDQTRLIY